MGSSIVANQSSLGTDATAAAGTVPIGTALAVGTVSDSVNKQ